MKIKKITTEVGIGDISGAEENQIRSLEPARKEFYEAFIKFSESLSELGDANLLKKHVGFVVNKIVIGYKDGEKKSYTAYGFVKVEDYPLYIKFTTGGMPYGIFNKLDECLEILIEEAEKYISGDRAQGDLFEEAENEGSDIESENNEENRIR